MNRFTRRRFLKGLGGFSLALPLLPSLLLPEEARAQVLATPPKRFIAIGNFDGYYEPVYYPTVAADTQFASDVYYKSLTSISGNISEVFNSQFDPFRSKMNIYRGLDITGSMGHSVVNMLCGAARVEFGDNSPIDPVGTSRSIDVVMAKSQNFYPTAPQFSVLRGQEPSYDYSISFDKDAANKTIRIPFTGDSTDMFQQVFGNRILDPAVADKFKTKKVTIGDIVLQDYKGLLNHRRISSDDKIVLNNFVDNLQALNNRINSAPTVITCAKPTMRKISTGYWDLMTDTDRQNFFSNYIDTMVAAMACDLTRIGIISIRLWGHDHSLSHADPKNRSNQLQYIANTAKITKIVTELATKMNSVSESNGMSMLDNSILFWGNEDSNGAPHSTFSMPACTIGSAGGKIKTGYYMDYRQKPMFLHPDGQYLGRSYTQLLITIMKSMGLQPAEYLSYGDGGGFGSFDVKHPYTENRYAPYAQYRNDPLPFIYQG